MQGQLPKDATHVVEHTSPLTIKLNIRRIPDSSDPNDTDNTHTVFASNEVNTLVITSSEWGREDVELTKCPEGTQPKDSTCYFSASAGATIWVLELRE